MCLCEVNETLLDLNLLLYSVHSIGAIKVYSYHVLSERKKLYPLSEDLASRHNEGPIRVLP